MYKLFVVKLKRFYGLGLIAMCIASALFILQADRTYAAAIQIDLASVSSDGDGFTYASNLLTFTTAANGNTYTLTGATTLHSIEISTGVSLTFVLDNALINVPGTAINLNSGSSLALTLLNGTSNELQSTSAGAGINVPAGASLTIAGTGQLTAKGSLLYAGIGGGGTITIDDGIINVPQGFAGYAAGIGGHNGTNAGNITINGGTITVSGYNGAAIGDGSSAPSGGILTINGGTVHATSTYHGAAIGGGLNGSGNTCEIVIKDGDITALSNAYGAAIGGSSTWGTGVPGNNNRIEINGGHIVASARSAAAIGGGIQGDGGPGGDGGTILITGGTIEATSTAAAIGGGNANGSGDHNGGAADITITGGSLTVVSGSAHAIGGGAGSGTGLAGNAVLEISEPAEILAFSLSLLPAIQNTTNLGDALIASATVPGTFGNVPRSAQIVDHTIPSDVLHTVVIPKDTKNIAVTTGSITQIDITTYNPDGSKHELLRNVPATNPEVQGLSRNLLPYYNVVLHAGSGYFAFDPTQAETSVQVVSGDQVIENGLPTLRPQTSAYYFAGWYADENCTIPWNFGQSIVGTTELYARWLPIAVSSPQTGDATMLLPPVTGLILSLLTVYCLMHRKKKI